jgi:hypothetical protein
MNNKPIQKRDLAAATRGLIVQRVLVDGWTPEEAGAPFGVDGPSVARWVAAYQRDGMAALRGDAASERGPLRWIACVLGWFGARSRGGVKRPATQGADRPGAPTRRWN